MTDSFVEEETTLEKGRLRRLFERAAPPTDSEIASALSTLNSARGLAKTKKIQRDERELEQANSGKKRKDPSGEKKDTLLLLALLESQIQFLESSLADRYGEDFAENLAAEYLDEETYRELMAIEDQEERRHAIAIAIAEGIENGSIDPSELYKDPEIRDWLEKHSELNVLRREQTLTLETSEQNLVQSASLADGVADIFKL